MIIAIITVFILLTKILLILSKLLAVSSKLASDVSSDASDSLEKKSNSSTGIKSSLLSFTSKNLKAVSVVFKGTSICLGIPLVIASFCVVLYIGIIFISAGSFLSLFMSTDGGNLVWASEALSVATGSSTYKPTSSSGSTYAYGKKPPGITDESWNSADDVGKAVASFASNVIINPPNGVPLEYEYGGTRVGEADCSNFVCACLQGALRKTFAGRDTLDTYDFATSCRNDLKDSDGNNSYYPTSSMWTVVQTKPDCIVGKTPKDLDKAQPGDILLISGSHVQIYVGVNENGEHIVVHAASDESPCCFGDTLRVTGGSLECGFSKSYGNFTIIRTSKLLGL